MTRPPCEEDLRVAVVTSVGTTPGVSSEVLSTIPLIGGVAIGQLLMDKGGGFEVVAEL